MNIATEIETEKVHFESKQSFINKSFAGKVLEGFLIDLKHAVPFYLVTRDTASTQTWMNVLKMLLVLGVAAGQVFLVTQHFNKGAGGGSRRHADINPFAKSAI